MKIGIVVPVYIKTDKHLEFTLECLSSLYSSHEMMVYLVPTVCDKEYLAQVMSVSAVRGRTRVIPIKENCVARAWNLGIYRALSDECDYVAVINSDVTCFDDTFDELVRFADENRDAVMWSAYMREGRGFDFDRNGQFIVNHVTVWNNYSFFMVNGRLFDEVGRFDENYKPAYGEDIDMEYRIHLAREAKQDNSIKHLCTRTSAYNHLGNGVINGSENKEVAFHKLSQFAGGNIYVNAKWGGERDKMTKAHPFDDKKRDYRDVGYGWNPKTLKLERPKK